MGFTEWEGVEAIFFGWIIEWSSHFYKKCWVEEELVSKLERWQYALLAIDSDILTSE